MIAMLFKRFCFGLLVVATNCVIISGSNAAPPQKPKPAIDRRDEIIERKLAESTEIDFVDVPLQDAVDYLKDLHELTMTIDTAALEKAKINSDVTITKKAKNVPLGKALDAMLLPLKLNYMVKNHMLTISTAEAVAVWKESRIKKTEK